MAAPLEIVSALPVAIVVVLAALRWGAPAFLTLFAGIVAILTRDPKRAERALEVLRVAESHSSWLSAPSVEAA